MVNSIQSSIKLHLAWPPWDSLAMESPRSVRLSRTQVCVLLAIGFPPVLCSGCIGALFHVKQDQSPNAIITIPHVVSFVHEMKGIGQ